jgi:hypothetical protein
VPCSLLHSSRCSLTTLYYCSYWLNFVGSFRWNLFVTMATMLIASLSLWSSLDVTWLAGMTLWSLALYLGFFPVSEWVIEQLIQWLNFAERSLYASAAEFERTRKARESRNAFLASLLSIVPFLIAGGGCNWLVDIGLGRSWTISMGIIACIGCGVYELGRRDGQSAD